VGKRCSKSAITLAGQTRIIDGRRTKSGLVGNGLPALALSARRQDAPHAAQRIAIEDFVLWRGLRFSGKEGAALRCEPLNQEYDPLKGDSLVAATRTEKGLDYVRL
jgi:hypothetical protein